MSNTGKAISYALATALVIFIGVTLTIYLNSWWPMVIAFIGAAIPTMRATWDVVRLQLRLHFKNR
jgi:hypothetical protein